MSLAKVKVTTNGVGHGTVEVNGVDVTDGVHAVNISAAVGQICQVHIAAQSQIEVEGEGVVYIDQGMDQAQAVQAWLDGLDASALESEALADSTLAGGTTGELFLGVLKKWARGD